MRIATARRLGGTSNLWGGRSMPLDPIDFVPRPFVGGARWPIGYDDVAPYYATACRYVGCGEAAFTLAAPELVAANDDFAFDRIERASNRPWFQKAHAATLAASPLIDIRLGATVVEIEFAENGRATGVVAATADGRRLRLAAERVVLAAGGLESTRLLLAAQRRRPALFGGVEGPLGRYYMGHVIGEIADVVFDDARVDAAFDFLRDGRGSFVRRRFAPSPALMARFDLPNVGFWPVAPPIADPRHGSGALSAVAMALSTPLVGGMILPELIRARHLGGSIDWLAHARNVASDLPATIAFLARFVRDRYFSAERIPGYFLRNRARRYGLSYHAEQIPNPDSRVTLAAETDRLGLPRLRVDLRFSRDDGEAIARAHTAARAVAFRLRLRPGRIPSERGGERRGGVGVDVARLAPDRNGAHGREPPRGRRRRRSRLFRRAQSLCARLGGLSDLRPGQSDPFDRRFRGATGRKTRRRRFARHAPEGERACMITSPISAS